MLAGCLVSAGLFWAALIVSGQTPAAGDDRRAVEKTHHLAHKVSAPNPFPHRIKLPADLFEGGAGWLNVSGPIELPDLRGKIVVVDFWTFCCINCMHILPDLKFLEHKYPRELVVIGVHSAKFNNEKDTENIRRAILRYEIEHPVVNDSQMAIWRRCGVNSWPTLAVIDPDGKLVRGFSGEGHREDLDAIIGKLIAYHAANGTLERTPLKLGLERKKLAPTPLRFPGKVLADEKGGRLFIADSNHNRIVVSSLAGKLIEVAGSGSIGRNDGPFSSATFHHPQGMALDGANLYVADTENHLIRVLDLESKIVSTLAGTGRQDPHRAGGGRLRETSLNSPWDLAVLGRTLYIAMAGAHQIWFHHFGSGTLHSFAGNGREDIVNGTRESSSFAQPSGLATDGRSLFIADSEGSAIRRILVSNAEPVTTIAGTSDLEFGRSLFEFGDVDDAGGRARFQHPLGLAYHDGQLFVADTYNHKIKTLNISTGESKTWLGTGKRGNDGDAAEFAEPGGLSVAGTNLYIADTNNHAIKVADLGNRRVSTLKIEGLSAPSLANGSDATGEDEDGGSRSAIKVESQRVALADGLRLEFSLQLPLGYKLNKLAPASCRIRSSGPTPVVSQAELAKPHQCARQGNKLVARIPLAGQAGRAVLEASLSFTYCRDGVGGVCKLGSAQWSIPIEVADDAKQTSIALKADIQDR